MRSRKIIAVWGLVLLSAMFVTACNSGDGPTTPPVSQPPSTAPADPLVGEWHQRFSCEQNVRMFQRRMSQLTLQQRQEQADVAGTTDASLAGLLKVYTRPFAWGPHAETAGQITPEALCAGAPEREVILRIQEGQVVILNSWDGSVELDGTYRIVDAHTFSLNDGNQDLGGTYRFTFEIRGDRLTFEKLGRVDPWGDNEFDKTAPWIRVS